MLPELSLVSTMFFGTNLKKHGMESYPDSFKLAKTRRRGFGLAIWKNISLHFEFRQGK